MSVTLYSRQSTTVTAYGFMFMCMLAAPIVWPGVVVYGYLKYDFPVKVKQ